MKCNTVLFWCATASALPGPWLGYPDSDAPSLLERRGRGGGKQKMRNQISNHIVTTTGFNRAKSPPREGDTRATVKGVGQAWLETSRAKDAGSAKPSNGMSLVHGQKETLETHDADWTRVGADGQGKPSSNSFKQHAALYPFQTEVSGRSGEAFLSTSDNGAGRLRKIVNGQTVMDEKVGANKRIIDRHEGESPNELTYKLSHTHAAEHAAVVSNNKVPPPLDPSSFGG